MGQYSLNDGHKQMSGMQWPIVQDMIYDAHQPR